jgi:hypothetical protein
MTPHSTGFSVNLFIFSVGLFKVQSTPTTHF